MIFIFYLFIVQGNHHEHGVLISGSSWNFIKNVYKRKFINFLNEKHT